MKIFNQVKTKIQSSKQFLQKILEDYILFSLDAKQLTLKQKTVLLLCQQAVSGVEKLKSLEPDSQEGLIATIEYKEIQIKVHFTPEKITLNKDCIEGQLRLLNPPQFESDSLVYRCLIASWKMFLGGKIPEGTLPEGVRLESDCIYYTLPRNQLRLLDVLFSSFEDGSVLITKLSQGELIIESSVALSWHKLKVENLLQILQLRF